MNEILVTELIAAIAFESAGAASAPFMEDHPDYVMPSERINEGVREVLRHYGIEPNDLPGYGENYRPPKQDLQGPIDRAYAALRGSEYVGGPSERDAWREALEALAPVVTQHVGQA